MSITDPFSFISSRILSKNEATIRAQFRIYHPIKNAADIVGCSAGDLLHLGALNKLDLCSPIKMSGIYVWLTESSGLAFPGVEGPLEYELSGYRMVIVSPSHLTRIEYTGSAVIDMFYAPDLAQAVLPRWTDEDYKDYNDWESDKLAKQATLWESIIENPESAHDQREFAKEMLNQECTSLSHFHVMQEAAHNTPWFAVSIDDPSLEEPIGLEHLHVSQEELLRLIENRALRPTASEKLGGEVKLKKPGVALANLQKRYEVLHAAIYHLYHHPDECRKKNRKWAEFIGQRGAQFWDQNQPNLSLGVIEQLLGKVINLPTTRYVSKKPE